MGLNLLGIPIGTTQCVDPQIEKKLDSCATILESLNDIPDTRIKFHMHRVSASACKIDNPFRLKAPQQSILHALRFDEEQIQAYH